MGKYFVYKGMPFVADYGVQTCLEWVNLDIETSHEYVDGELVTWISSIQLLWGKEYHLFRTAEELCNWYNDTIKAYGFGIRGNSIRRLVTYIHNAKFDLSYLIPFFKVLLPDYVDDEGLPLTNEKGRPLVMGTLSLDEHEIIQYAQGPLLWRCSYKLSNRSLENWGEVMNIEHKKKVGYYDYNKVIYPDTPLSEEEQQYDKYDVLALQECLRKQMSLNHEALAEYNGLKRVPLTSTGYVRRDLSESCLKSKSYMKIFNEGRMTGEIYHACLCSYSGGYTHNNRFYADTLIETGKSYKCHGKTVHVESIGHRDFTSHYPTQMVKESYPLGKWSLFYQASDDNKICTVDDVLKEYPRYSCIVYMRIHKAWLRDLSITMPFLQECKLIYDKTDLKRKTVDNGRIMYIEFKEGNYCDFYVDNITLSILKEQYHMEYEIGKVWECPNMKLPREITDIINKYFKGKSDKKIEWKKAVEDLGELAEKTIQTATELQLVKAWLNAIYGCFATRPVRENWIFDTQTLQFKLDAPYELTDSKDEIAYKNYMYECEGIEHYYESNNNFVPFIVGVMVTAYARKQLYDFVTKCIGYENILYCDTDSAYYISNSEVEKRIEDMNTRNRAVAPFVTASNGKKVYYDYFDSEGSLRAFKGLHSKCYGYVNEHNEFKLTVAGVPARTIIGMDGDKPIYLTREDELAYYVKGKRVTKKCTPVQALDKLRDGYVFYINTGLTAKYINYGEIRIYDVNGHKVTTGGGCVLLPAKHKEIKEFKITEIHND